MNDNEESKSQDIQIFRCPECGKRLFDGLAQKGTIIKIVCPRCTKDTLKNRAVEMSKMEQANVLRNRTSNDVFKTSPLAFKTFEFL